VPVVLVHGLSGSSRWWRPVLPLLNSGREVRVVELPRPGRSFPPSATAGWLAASLDRETDLVGHSLGGLVAATVAAERPDLVRRLVLVAPVGAGDPVPVTRYGAGLARTLASAPAPLLWTIISDAARWGPAALTRGAVAAMRHRFDGDVAAPTLIVWGSRDPLVPTDLARAWLRLIPGARLEILRGAGHVPMVDAPSSFARVVLRFLDEPSDVVGVGPLDGVSPARDDREPPARQQ
jgi:pimeloyl-ACP methyl ester carboxylesterase